MVEGDSKFWKKASCKFHSLHGLPKRAFHWIVTQVLAIIKTHWRHMLFSGLILTKQLWLAIASQKNWEVLSSLGKAIELTSQSRQILLLLKNWIAYNSMRKSESLEVTMKVIFLKYAIIQCSVVIMHLKVNTGGWYFNKIALKIAKVSRAEPVALNKSFTRK